MNRALITTIVFLIGTHAMGAIHTQTVQYTQGGTHLLGYLACDDTAGAKRPGVLVVHAPSNSPSSVMWHLPPTCTAMERPPPILRKRPSSPVR